ncbi:MAG: exosortase/archaeosortase family protein [Phycisphaeraceae bacterium]|nr:exosortase/archaeosortase family protein [Phycisphaerales bacterium]MCB9860993.1 exosortase/archaeosortase family protein [Phycisphaeraceae bacterium]
MSNTSQRHFTTLGIIALAFAAVAAYAGRAALRDIWDLGWHNEEQSHVLLALPVALWLAYLRRGRVRHEQWRPTWLGPLCMLAGYGISLFGFSTGTDILWHFGAISMILAAGLTTFGPGLLRQFMPAIVALLFLLPVPGTLRQEISIPLQRASAASAHVLIDIMGLPVTRDGNVLTVNGHEVKVVDACDGMRMVSALAIVAYAFVFSVPMRNNVRALILAISPAIAIVVNVLRLVPTAIVYGYAEHESTGDLVHDIGGWAVLGLALILLWGFLRFLRWLEVPVDPHNVDAG